MRKPSPMISPIRMRGLSDAYGILEDHLHLAAHLAHRRSRQRRQLLTLEGDGAAGRLDSAARGNVPGVVLPQPDSPTSPTVSPSSTSKLTPSIALTCSCARAQQRRPAPGNISSGRGFRAAPSYAAMKQATRWCVSTSTSGGCVCAQRASARAQRSRKRQPVGQSQRIGNHAGNGLEPLLRRAPAGHRVQQADRVGMLAGGRKWPQAWRFPRSCRHT